VNLSTHSLSVQILLFCIRSFNKFSRILCPHYLSRALPQKKVFKRSTYIDFAENQISLGLIGLSPLTTNHLSIFPHTRVRSSNKRYRLKFNQFMVRSPSFGFYFRNLTAILNLIFFSLHIICLSSPLK
jgi:hypothetical protein